MPLREMIGVNSDNSTEHIGLNTLRDKMCSFCMVRRELWSVLLRNE
jgi:hypothetical protein